MRTTAGVVEDRVAVSKRRQLSVVVCVSYGGGGRRGRAEPIPVEGNPSPIMRCEAGLVAVPFVKSKPVPFVSSTPPVGNIASVRPTFLVD